MASRDLVQVLNPRVNRYVKIDRSTGHILSHKQSRGPYKGVPIITPRARSPKEESQ